VSITGSSNYFQWWQGGPVPRNRKFLERPAIQIWQNDKYPLYLFALTGEELHQVADISRIGRDGAGILIGYQRAEVRRHIKNIVEYLDSDAPLFPNSLIVSLNREVRFAPTGRANKALTCAGIIRIPLTASGDRKPGWIVDGQQRALALKKTSRKEFPVAISAFIADDVELQRDQFLRVNSTKPLPRGLITELLPTVSTVLPSVLAARKVPSALCEMLNEDKESPFYGLIRRASMDKSRRKKAVVSDTVIVQMLGDSLSMPTGSLFSYTNVATGKTDLKGARNLVFTFWNAVKETFPEAWGLPPSQSRLMHGAGIRAMGRLMDKMMGMSKPDDRRFQKRLRVELAELKPNCRWTSGSWETLGGIEWNEIQNLPSHIKMLSNHLVHTYLSLS
jgi:DGQHR domain-containing protein